MSDSESGRTPARRGKTALLWSRKPAILAFLALPASLVAAPLTAQLSGPLGPHVADPALDRPDLPFSYPSRPTDVIGVMDGRGTEITPEGFLYTGWRRRPAAVVVHLPFFMNVTGATADGRAVAIRDGAVRLSPGTRELRLTWTRCADAPALSYARAVEELKAACRKRCEDWLRTGR